MHHLRLLLSLFPILGATAFNCNQSQQSHNFPCRDDSTQKVPAKATLPSSSLLGLMIASQTQQPGNEQQQFSRASTILSERTWSMGSLDFGGPNKKPRCRCPDDEESEDESELLEDRREALFAAMGGLWAVATTATTSTALLGLPEPSLATAGTDANMAFPDVMQGLNDRNTKQCLVESLGNRECLVYKETDPDKLLYKGANAQILVDRVKKAADALKDIPPLVEKKKWNDVNGLLIGPMGELSSTLTLLCGGDAAKTKLARKVKEDLFAMGTATTQRQQDVILKYHAAATTDLAKFLEVAL